MLNIKTKETKMLYKTIAIMCVVIITLMMFLGCSNATLRNNYDKEGAISEFQGEGSYYHSRIIITTPDTPRNINGEPVMDVERIVEEDNSYHPFWEQIPGRNSPSRYNRNCQPDPYPLPRSIH